MLFTVAAADQVYKQTLGVVFVAGAISVDRDLSDEITRRLQRTRSCPQRHKMEIYDRRGVRLRPEGADAENRGDRDATVQVSDGARTSLTTTGYGGLTTPCSYHASVGGNGSAATTLSRTPMRLPDSESIETTVRKWRMLLAGFVARTGEERLTRRVIFRELVGGKGCSGGQKKDSMVHLKEDVTGFSMKFEGWRKAAQKAGRCFRRVEVGAEAFVRKWRDVEVGRATERHGEVTTTPVTTAPLTTAPPTVVSNTRLGGVAGRRGRGRPAHEAEVWVWPL